MSVCCNMYILFRQQQCVSLVRHQCLHSGTWFSQKKKWTKDEISSLAAWKYETNAIFGPRINVQSSGSTISRVKHKPVHELGRSQSKDGNLVLETTGLEMKADETWTTDLPYSVSMHISSGAVLENTVQNMMPCMAVNSHKASERMSHVTGNRQTEFRQSDESSKHDSAGVVHDSIKRGETFGYEWVDSPSQLTCGAKVDNNEQFKYRTSSRVNVSRDTPATSDTSILSSVANVAAASEVLSDADVAHKDNSHPSAVSFPLFVSPALTADPRKTENLSIRLPSVSSILKATMSPESQLALSRWEQRMIAELGEDGFDEHKKAIFANGSNFHSAIHQYLSGKPECERVLLPANLGHWHSIESVLAEITDVVCLEKYMRHSHLQYCGVLDCVTEYRGEKHVIEWKTSKRQKSNIQRTYDNPLQLVAYLGAYNIQPSTPLQVERCLLVIAYEDGSRADVHVMDKWDCLSYWSNWLQRLSLYRTGIR